MQGSLLPGWCFMLLLWSLLLPERSVLLLLGVFCVRTVFYVAAMVFFVAATPAGTHDGNEITSRCLSNACSEKLSAKST